MTTTEKTLETQVSVNGYAVVNVQDIYFYTVGMAAKGKKDLIGISQYPRGLFEIVASKWYNNEVEENKGFFVPEYKIPGSGSESSRVKLLTLRLKTCGLIQDALAKPSQDFESEGFLLVAGPDKDNFIIGEEDCSFKFTQDELIQHLVSSVKKDVDIAVNEAQVLLKSLGVK